MFFELSKKVNPAYTKNYEIGDYILSTDDGWKEIYRNGKKAVVKGYCLEVPLEVAAFEIPTYRGMFCSIADTDMGVLVTHGIFRNFDLYQIKDGVSNFDFGTLIAHDSFWRNNIVEYFDIAPFTLPKISTLNEAINLIDTYLEENVRDFVKQNTLPIISTITGGLDTSSVYSYLESMSVPNKPIIDLHFEFNQFIVDNAEKFGKLADWVMFTNHYRSPCVVTSGFGGDYIFLRVPEIMSALDENNTYTYEQDDYVDLTYNDKLSLGDVTYTIANVAGIFHLGNTIYFNPLLDMRIPLTLLQVERNELIDAVKKGNIQRMLIAKRCPWVEPLLPKTKEIEIYKQPMPRKSFLKKILEITKSK